MQHRFRSAVTLCFAVVLAASAALPASAHRGFHGKYHPFGEITSFDGTTLVVTSLNDEVYSFPVADALKVKVEHRGHKARGKGVKKPSNGSVDDLQAGARVMRMKIDCGEVTKIRLRRAPADATTEPAPVTAAGTRHALTEVHASGCSDDEPATEDDSDDDSDDEGSPVTAPDGSGTDSGDTSGDDGSTGDGSDGGETGDDGSDGDDGDGGLIDVPLI